MEKQLGSELTKLPSDGDSNPALAANPSDQCDTTVKIHSTPHVPNPRLILRGGLSKWG